MENLLQDWEIWLKMRSNRPATIKYYIGYLTRSFRDFDYGWRDFSDREKIYEVWGKIWKKDISNSSRKKYLTTMRLFADFLLYKGFIDVNYPREIKSPKIQKAIPFAMDRLCFTRIYNAIERRWWTGDLGKRNKMLFDTLAYTGLRREEVTKLRRDDFDGEKIRVRDGKWGKSRTVFLPQHFAKELEKYMKETTGQSEYIFFVQRPRGEREIGDKLSPDTITIIFRRIAQYAGMRVFPHLMRHTYASNCILDGIDIYTLQQQLGHGDIKTTSIYLYMNDEARYNKMQLLK